MQQELENLRARMDELESRLAFQDDLMAVLNETVSQQAREFLKLWEANRILRDRLESARGSNIRNPEDEVPPPHY